MTADLVAFLRARLDEDEQAAQSAGGQRWSRLGELPWVNTELTDKWQPPGSDHHVANVPLDSDRDHIIRHDPARVLAEVNAKREVIRLTERAYDYHETFLTGFASAMEGALRLFAVSYASHPDYREEWRPA